MEIYIVEDDMSVISVLQDIIEDNDLGIVCGTSEGQPADVDDILAKNPDMVLIDFLMPEKDGVQVMRELRERGCKAKCIMISQVAAKELIGKAYDAGIEFFISKLGVCVLRFSTGGSCMKSPYIFVSISSIFPGKFMRLPSNSSFRSG